MVFNSFGLWSISGRYMTLTSHLVYFILITTSKNLTWINLKLGIRLYDISPRRSELLIHTKIKTVAIITLYKSACRSHELSQSIWKITQTKNSPWSYHVNIWVRHRAGQEGGASSGKSSSQLTLQLENHTIIYTKIQLFHRPIINILTILMILNIIKLLVLIWSSVR